MTDSLRDVRWERAEAALERGDGPGALYLFKSLAQSGDECAYINLAHLYELGEKGIAQNYPEALKWYRKSLYEASEVRAAVDLARMHLWGIGVDQDYTKARELLELAEPNRKAVVYLMLGQIYWYGLGVEKNAARGKRYFLRALAKDNVRAYVYLGSVMFSERRWLKAIWLRAIAVVKSIQLLAVNREDQRLRYA